MDAAVKYPVGHIPLDQTLGDDAWLKENRQKIKEMLPETWTDLRNVNILQLAFKMKLLGIDWRSEEEFGKVLVFFERTKIMERNHMLIRRSPD